MAGENLLALAEKCVQDEEAYCKSACPLRVDARQLIQCIQNGNFRAAYRQYARQAIFPGIVSRICPQPCRNACIRSDIGGALQIRELEAAVCRYGSVQPTIKYASRRKEGNVAVVGGGLFGLCCAILLSERGYSVRLFEREGQLGGTLWKTPGLTPEVIRAECDRVFQAKNLEISLNTNVASLEELAGYDAVLLATGSGGDCFGQNISQLQDGVKVNGKPVLGGGKLVRPDSEALQLLAYGRVAAAAVSCVLDNTSPPAQCALRPTKLVTNTDGLEYVPPVKMADGSGYSMEEAVAEAKRCILCECKICVSGCSLLSSGRTYPKKCINEAYQDLNTLDKIEPCMMKRQIYSCTLCGRCGAVCPEGVETARAFLEARRTLYQKGKLPPAFHDFWIQDMLFSNREAGCLVPQRNGKPCLFIFFPGCQAAASMPEAVKKTYGYLLEKLDGTVAMRLGCCGAPAYWAGMQEEFLREVDILRRDWAALGSPAIITGCPSCQKLLRAFFPEARLVSLWEQISLLGLPKETQHRSSTLAVFDPCAARDEEELCSSVRKVLRQTGLNVIELKDNRKKAKCCGHGGLIQIANPKLAKEFAQSCISESDADYVTYCVNCRDIFLLEGKRSWHMLDILFGLPAPSVDEISDLSQRRQNRRALREEFLCSPAPAVESRAHLNLIVPQSIREKMNRSYILEEDVKSVIRHLEEAGDGIWDEERECITGSRRIGAVTIWVSYRKSGQIIELLNVYSHRMRVQEETARWTKI